MASINVYKQRVNELRDRTHQIIGKRDSLRENLFKCEDKEKQIVEAGIRVGKAKFLLELFVKGTETQVKEYIEPTITEALRFIFNQHLSFHIVFVTRRGQVEVDFIVLPNEEKEKEYQKYIADLEVHKEIFNAFISNYTDIGFLYGGAVLEILGLILRLLLVEFLSIEGPVILDEPTSAVHETYASRVGVFIKSLSEKFNRQIIFVTHSKALASSANKVYEVIQEDNISRVEEL